MSVVTSIGQMDVHLGKPAENLAKADEWSAEAARRGSRLIVFPELWPTGYELEKVATHATPLSEGAFAQMAVLARKHRLAVYGSCLSVIGDGQYGNTAALYGPTGELLGAYTKVHLFRPMHEDRFLVPGRQLTLARTEWAKVGLSVCYDLRFPEMYRAYAVAGAELMLVCAEWPNPRSTHWHTLLRARAIENQAFVIAGNRVGESRGTSFFGGSCIVDPNGNVLAEAGDTEELLTAEIDLAQVVAARQLIPVLQDGQPNVYEAMRRSAKCHGTA
jgi:omega-amidase